MVRILILVAIAAGVIGFVPESSTRLLQAGDWVDRQVGYPGSRVTVKRGGDCNIKGNISRYGGQRIYHVPSQRYYTRTIVDPSNGERWFCSEAEARAAGWRRSRR